MTKAFRYELAAAALITLATLELSVAQEPPNKLLAPAPAAAPTEPLPGMPSAVPLAAVQTYQLSLEEAKCRTLAKQRDDGAGLHAGRRQEPRARCRP